MDLLDDFLSEPSAAKAPAANRFKPKAKPRRQKGPSVAAKDTNEQPVKSAAKDSASNPVVRSDDLVDKQSDVPVASSFTSNATDGAKGTSTDKATVCQNQLTDGNLTAEANDVMDSAGRGYSETVVSESNEDGILSIDASLNLQSQENTIGQSTDASKLPFDMPTLDATSTQNAEETSTMPDISFASASPFRPCAQTATDLSMPSTYQDSEFSKEATITSDAGELWINIEAGAVGFSSLEGGDIIGEAATTSGQRPIKFQPKPKTHFDRRKDAMELPYENHHMDGDSSIYAGEPYTVSGLSNAKLDSSFCKLNPATTQPDNVVYEDADSWMAQNLPEQCGEQGKSTASDFDLLNSTDKSLEERTVLSSGANEDGHEINDGVHDNSNAESCDQVANEAPKKRRPRKSKKLASENDESGGKRRKVTKVPDQSTSIPPKKVPSAPRRKRCVDKALLEAPEDELDLQRVPIKDLIILAEYKERQTKKNAAAVQPSLANERTDNTLSEEPPYDDYGNTWDYDQDGESYDNPSTAAVVEDSSYFNYHSYMDKSKTTKVRWSKAETELFYQGIQEFGSDFLMIQKLHFPGRTRQQIKLKYKKEERENPVRLHDALNSRAKDLSHFEILAQRLQKEAAKRELENQMSDGDYPTSPTSEEEVLREGTPKTHPTSRQEADKEDVVADEVPETVHNGSPPKSHGNDEDDFNWDDYKSGL